MGPDEIPPLHHAEPEPLVHGFRGTSGSGSGWEPAGLDELHQLRALVDEAAAVEGDVARALERLTAGAPTGQIVTWAWVTDPKRREVLLVDHAWFGHWEPPGGRVQPGETALEAVTRELVEETGITTAVPEPAAALVDVVRNVDPDGAVVDTFGVAYAFTVDRAVPLVPEPGQPVAWWPLSAPPTPKAEHHWARLVRHLTAER